MKAKSRIEAWDMVGKLFPYDFEKDEHSSQNAGFPIFRSTSEEHYNNCISDLGCRLEINFENGVSTNIWIETEPEGMEIEVLLKDGHKIIYSKKDNATVNFVDNGYIKFYNITSNEFTTSYHVEQVESITIKN